MSVAIPVIPAHINLLSDEQELYHLLIACQEHSLPQEESQIVSFSQPLDIIDPLGVFEAIIQSNQLHFYWENPSKNEAIFGYGVTKSLLLNGSNRFQKSQEFVDDCFQKIIRIGNPHILAANPHLFCSFTFFAEEQSLDAPFPAATIFLPQIQIVKKKNSCALVINVSLKKSDNIKFLLKQIQNQITLITRSQNNSIKRLNPSVKLPKQAKIYSHYDFKSSVASALNSIQNNQFSKLVLAHTLDVVLPNSLSLVESLNNLRQNHPDCYIFSISNSQGQYFIGASPERLISIQNKQIVTDALAGSAPRGKTAIEDADFAQKLLNSGKERREHQAVIEFITQRLFQLGLTPQLSPLKLLQLSNIQHLWTPIYAQLKPHIHPLEIVAKLHPTPAVAGVPTDIACEQIRHYESFDRSLYAAPLGWIDYEENSEFIVGIRSALIEGNHALLYAGAGIVAGSDPEKELAEIKLKFQALLKALL